MKKAMMQAVAAVAVVGALGFGTVQAFATDSGPQPVGCTSWACRNECAPFGGNLGPGGPGQPLVCRCCG